MEGAHTIRADLVSLADRDDAEPTFLFGDFLQVDQELAISRLEDMQGQDKPRDQDAGQREEWDDSCRRHMCRLDLQSSP
jgi:hypothetical protein